MGRMITGVLSRRGDMWRLLYTVSPECAPMGPDAATRCGAEVVSGGTVAPAGDAGRLREEHDAALRACDDRRRPVDLSESGLPRLAVADAWDRYVAEAGRPQSGQVTIRDHASRWRRFTRWLSGVHPATLHMESVTAETAKQFAGTLAGLSPNRYNRIVQTCRLVFRILMPPCGPARNPSMVSP